MDFYHGENNRTNNTSYNNKKRLSHEQVRLLERSFNSSRKLEPERKLQLASQLGIPPRQVAVWYQNKRARWRTQSLEMDCGAMQMRLDHVVAEKRMLEKEVDRLRRELEKAKESLFAADYKKNTSDFSWYDNSNNNNNNEVEGSAGCFSFCDTINYNNSTSYDQDGTTLNVDDDDDDQVVEFDHELFSSFIHGKDDDDESFF